MLYAVTAAAGGHVEVRQLRVNPDQQILVEIIVVVIAGPCTFELQVKKNNYPLTRR